MELLLSRNRLTATQAHSIGLVNLIIPRDDFDRDIQSFASEIAEIPAAVARAIKSTINASQANSHPNSETAAVQAFAELWAADDHWAAVDKLRPDAKALAPTTVMVNPSE